MTAFVRALSDKAANIEDTEALNWLMTFSSAGLFVSLLYLINGDRYRGRVLLRRDKQPA